MWWTIIYYVIVEFPAVIFFLKFKLPSDSTVYTVVTDSQKSVGRQNRLKGVAYAAEWENKVKLNLLEPQVKDWKIFRSKVAWQI